MTELVEEVKQQRPQVSWSDLTQDHFFEQLNSKHLTYKDLKDKAQEITSERGALEIEIIDIANLPSKSCWKLDDPCVLTIKDSKNNKFFKIFYYGEEEVKAIEITSA